jgi:hypothetical protein
MNSEDELRALWRRQAAVSLQVTPEELRARGSLIRRRGVGIGLTRPAGRWGHWSLRGRR